VSGRPRVSKAADEVSVVVNTRETSLRRVTRPKPSAVRRFLRTLAPKWAPEPSVVALPVTEAYPLNDFDPACLGPAAPHAARGHHAGTAAYRDAMVESGHQCFEGAVPPDAGDYWAKPREMLEDGFPVLPRGYGYRPTATHLGQRCLYHGVDNLHNWVDGAVVVADNAQVPTTIFLEWIAPAIRAMRAATQALGPADVVFVTAITKDYDNQRRYPRPVGFSHCIVFVDEEDVTYGREWANTTHIVHPRYVNGRSHALLRLLPHYFSDSQALFVCSNTATTANLPRDCLGLTDEAYGHYSVTSFCWHPSNCSAEFSRGRRMLRWRKFLAIFERLGPVYGADEIAPLYEPVIVQLLSTSDRHRLTNTFAVRGEDVGIAYTAVFVKAGWRAAMFVDGYNRRNVAILATTERQQRGIAAAPAPTTLADVRALGREPGTLFESTGLKYEPALFITDADVKRRVGPITIFTFGTRGDTVPLVGLAKVLVDEGYLVHLHHCLTREQGEAMLASVEAGESHTWLTELNDALDAVSSCHTVKFAPYVIADSHAITYSLAPPDDVVKPLRGGIWAWLEPFVSAYFANAVTEIHVGAYRRRGWLPRYVVDSFWQGARNQRLFPRAVVKGSSSIPFPPEYADWPVVPTGSDHRKELPKYEVLAFVPTAGLSQTAALAGAQCKALDVTAFAGGAPDRRVRRLDDPAMAALVDNSTDPRLMLAAVGLRDSTGYKRYLYGKGWLLVNLWRLAWWLPVAEYVPMVWLAVTVLVNTLAFRRARIVESGNPFITIVGTIFFGAYMSRFEGLAVMVAGAAYTWWRKEKNVSLWYTTRVAVVQSLKARLHWSWPFLTLVFPSWLVLLTTPWSRPILDATRLMLFKAIRALLAMHWREAGEPAVYLECRQVVTRFFPLFHTALVCPALGLRYEGIHEGEAAWGRAFSMKFTEGTLNPELCAVPTGMSIKDFKNLSPRKSKYGLFWTCQTGLLHQLAGSSWRLGILALLAMWTFISFSFVFGGVILLTALVLAALGNVPASILGEHPAVVFPALKALYEDFDLDLGRPEGETEGWLIGMYDWMVAVSAQLGDPAPLAGGTAGANPDRVALVVNEITSDPQYAHRRLGDLDANRRDPRLVRLLDDPADWPLVADGIALATEAAFSPEKQAEDFAFAAATLAPLRELNARYLPGLQARIDTVRDGLRERFPDEDAASMVLEFQEWVDHSPALTQVPDGEYTALVQTALPWATPDGRYQSFDWAVPTKVAVTWDFTLSAWVHAWLTGLMADGGCALLTAAESTAVAEALVWSAPHCKPGLRRSGKRYRRWFLRHRDYLHRTERGAVQAFDCLCGPTAIFADPHSLLEATVRDLSPKGVASLDKIACADYRNRDWSHVDSVIGAERRVSLVEECCRDTLATALVPQDESQIAVAASLLGRSGNTPSACNLTAIKLDEALANGASHALVGMLANVHGPGVVVHTDYVAGSYEAVRFFCEATSRAGGPPDLGNPDLHEQWECIPDAHVKALVLVLLPIHPVDPGKYATSAPRTAVSLKALADLGGALMADLMSLGPDSSVAGVATMFTLAAIAAEDNKRAPDSPAKARVLLFDKLQEHRAYGDLELGRVLSAVAHLRDFFGSIGYQSPLFGAAMRGLVNLAARVNKVLRDVGLLFNDAIEYILAKARDTFDRAIDLFAGLLNFTAPRLYRSAKMVWPFLFPDATPVLSAAEFFALSLPEMRMQEWESFEEQLESSRRRVNSFAPAGKELEPATPHRPLRFPRKFRAADKHELDGTEFHGEVIELDSWRAALDNYRARYSFKQGIDGAFFASRERELASLQRYADAAPDVEDSVRQIVFEAADTMADTFPSMFDDARPSTVEMAVNNLVTKYSPRLPFLTKYRSIRDMFDDGFYRTVVSTAKSYLREGLAPPELYNSFVKRQVVARDKAEGFIRTITAQDIISYAVAMVPSLERNKRVPPPDFRWGAGTPLTEGGMMADALALLEVERAGGKVVSMDEGNYDAGVHKVFMVSGLCRLAERGYRNHPNGKALASILKSHYKSMNKTWIYDLHHQFVVRKDKGGATGEAHVSWDNTMTKMMKDITCWSLATGKSPRDFFKTNVLLVTSDDEMWGSLDMTPELAQKICDISWEKFGQVTRIETTVGALKDQTYLSKLFDEDFDPAEYIRQGLPIPEVRIRTDPERILMRRSAFRSDKGGRPDAEFHMYSMERTIGHVQLLAHYPDLYHDLAVEFMDEAGQLFGADGHHWKTSVGVDGRYKAITFIPGRPRSNRLAGLQKTMRRAMRFPTYNEVMANWCKPAVRKSQDVIDAKIAKLGTRPTLVHAMTVGLTSFRKFVREVLARDVLAKAQPEKEGAATVAIFETQRHYTEAFSYRCLHAKLGRHPDSHEFAAAVRESAYSACCDSLGFWLLVGDLERRAEIMAYDMNELRNRMILLSVYYVLLDLVVERGKYVPFLGLVLELFHLWTRERSRLYALSNLIYWHSTGESSQVISGLIPKDPNAFLKQIACMLMESTPAIGFGWIPTGWLARIAPWASEMYVRYVTWRETNLFAPGGLAEGWKNPWTTDANALVQAISEGRPYHGLTARTATGKSTSLIAALAMAYGGKIWLIVPTETLRDEYDNQFLRPYHYQVLRRDVVIDQRAKVYTCTYGTWLVRRSMGEVAREDYIILDEPQEGTAEMILTWAYASNQPRLLLTATMRPELYKGATRMLVGSVQRRYKTEELLVPGTLEEVLAEAARHPDFRSRGLVIVNDLRTLQVALTSLNALGCPATELSSRQHHVPKSGAIVATSIVNQGVNIVPPPTVMVSANLETIEVRGAVKTQTCSPKTTEQQNGRVGRIKDGLVYRLARNRVGEDPLPYPSLHRFLENPGTTKILSETYGLAVKLETLPYAIGAESVFRYVGFRQGARLDEPAKASLRAYWGIAANFRNVRHALDAYADWYNGRLNSHLEFTGMLIRRYRPLALPVAAVQRLLTGEPFVVSWSGRKKVPCTGIYLYGDGFQTFENRNLRKGAKAVTFAT
jgi:hypothetical protein